MSKIVLGSLFCMAVAIAAFVFGVSSESPAPAKTTPAASPTESKPEADRETFAPSALRKIAAVEDSDVSNHSIAATELPVELLGTMVGEPVTLSQAVVLNTEKERHFTVGVGDPLLFHSDVIVVEIGRRRILLRTDDGLEELLLNRSARSDYTEQALEKMHAKSPAASATGNDVGAIRRKPLQSTAQLAKHRGAGISDELVEAMDRMAVNFSNDLEPSYNSSGEVDGLRATNITDGGLLEAAGVTREDVLQGINGVEITSAEGAKRVLRDLANCLPMTGLIMGRTGEREVEFTAEMLAQFDCVQ